MCRARTFKGKGGGAPHHVQDTASWHRRGERERGVNPGWVFSLDISPLVQCGTRHGVGGSGEVAMPVMIEIDRISREEEHGE